MTSFATHEDVAAAWRPLNSDEIGVASTRLEQASNLLRVQVPTIDTDIVGNELKSSLAQAAVVNAVIRVMQNPDGALSEKIDDYEFRRDAATSTGRLYIDPADIAGLLNTRRSRFRTIRLRAGLGVPSR